MVDAIQLKAIGIVRNSVKQPTASGFDWQNTTSEIEIGDELSEALDGLEGFSHIIVIYWMHRSPAGEIAVKIHPRGRQELPLVGLFATRSPHRPNPIGKATSELLQRRGNILKVKGLDAIDGTPVLDIKPYMPSYDAPADARTPPWTTRL